MHLSLPYVVPFGSVLCRVAPLLPDSSDLIYRATSMVVLLVANVSNFHTNGKLTNLINVTYKSPLFYASSLISCAEFYRLFCMVQEPVGESYI